MNFTDKYIKMLVWSKEKDDRYSDSMFRTHYDIMEVIGADKPFWVYVYKYVKDHPTDWKEVKRKEVAILQEAKDYCNEFHKKEVMKLFKIKEMEQQ